MSKKLVQKRMASFTSEPKVRKTNDHIEMEAKWHKWDGSAIIGEIGDVADSDRIASFDMDGTLITTLSEKTFATNANDWKLLFPTKVKSELQSLHQKGYKIVIFTNQLGVSKGKVKEVDLKKKIVNIAKEIEVPIHCFAATQSDKFRKPLLGMWDLFMQQNGNVMIDMDRSFYCGDAAGRPAGWKPKVKKDFSDSDRKFALNAGLKFYTPEEYFLGQATQQFKLSGIDPKSLQEDDSIPFTPSKEAELVINVGSQGSGKTFFTQKYLIPNGYVHVNQDTLKTAARCEKECTSALSQGKKVVIDNTNASPDKRRKYIAIAQKFKVPVRCLHFETDIELCFHNDVFREMTDTDRKRLAKVVLYTYRKNFVEPSLKEGFKEIIKIPFRKRFGSSIKDLEKKALYEQFLTSG